MNVAVISHAYQDERYLSVLEAMAQIAGIKVTLIHPNRYKGRCFSWDHAHAIAEIAVPVFWGSRQGLFLYWPRALARALDQCVPDVILHEQEVYALNAAQIAACASRRAVPLIQFVWENVDRELSWGRRMLRRYVLARAIGLIAGSGGSQGMHRRWGFSGPIAVASQMGVTPLSTCERPSRAGQTLKVCCVARLVAEKGVDCLLRSVAIMHGRGDGVECVVAGEGPERTRLPALAKDLSIDERVTFCNQLGATQVRELVRWCDVLVLASRRTRRWEEQFGLVLAEAMAEGTIPVGSRTGAIPEVVACEDLLFDENDADGLAAILTRLQRDPAFYLRSQRHALRQARERFAAEIVANQKVQFLREMLHTAAQQAEILLTPGRGLRSRAR